MTFTFRTSFVTLFILALGSVPAICDWIGQPYYVIVFTRILIFGLAALGLNLILGYSHMVSFGHSLYLGIGAYAVGVLSFHGVTSGWVHLLVAIGVAAACAIPIGLVCIRTSGMAFIMITLAFAQMFYFLAVSARTYGGDEGFSFERRSDFGIFSLSDDVTMYYVAFGTVAATMVILFRVVRSRFGMVIRGTKSNEQRMIALGFAVVRYKLTAYVISAVICAVAGFFIANLTRFVSPSYMHWMVSGELIIMVVLGGMGTLVGPLLGAAIWLLMEEFMSGVQWDGPWGLGDLISLHWKGILGLFIVAVTLTSMRGVYGSLIAREER